VGILSADVAAEKQAKFLFLYSMAGAADATAHRASAGSAVWGIRLFFLPVVVPAAITGKCAKDNC